MTQTPDWSGRTDAPHYPAPQTPEAPPYPYAYPPGPYPGSYPPPPMPYGGYPPPVLRNGLGVAALVVGIIALVGSFSVAGGIILGAVWANESWGRYWDWDPKETWAFITWLVYGVYIHGRIAGIFRGPTAAIWGIIGFNAVLFTLFGVSFVLPGLHSYLK